MRVADLDYVLPEELVAQEPAAERTGARLLVLDRSATELRHAHVADLPQQLRAGDLLVLNDTAVIPARVWARRPTGGKLEVLFVRAVNGSDTWEAVVRGSPRAGERVHFPSGAGEWLSPLGDGRWHLRLEIDTSTLAWLEQVGEVPLPPYIRRASGPSGADRTRYQTVYARTPGAVAAPTAGLHLTPELLHTLATHGIEHTALTLHVGPGTFLPLRGETLDELSLLSEAYELPASTVERMSATRAAGGRIVAVGTTTVRALESAAAEGDLRPTRGEATAFIRPGHRFRAVDALLTNFHLPRSSLLALVAAFAGWPRIRAAYEEAVRRGYRFYSYGDAMLIT